MKTHLLFPTLSLATLFTLLLASACKPQPESAVAAGQSEVSLEQYLLAEEPSHAISVSAAFSNPTPGTPIVVTGEVMGQLMPFVENRAMLVLGDPDKITPCNRIPGDSCETPWDACCDLPEVKKVSTATIQILGSDQRPLKKGLRGLGGMQELATLTVVGTIAEGSNAENLLITASGIHVGQLVEL